MAKKINSVVGIDIGSRRIKVCEMRTQGKDPVITAMGMIDTPEGAVDHTGVYNSDAVGVALKQVLSETGATVGQAVVSIAGQASVLVRTLEVPKMNPTELKEHMQWEINRNIPFAESTIVSDYKPLGGDDPNSPNMDVVMAISPDSAIQTVIKCIRNAGRSVAAIDVEPLSIARSIQTSYDDVLMSKTVCVVDIGHATTSINIYLGQKLLMPRQVPLGGEMFTRAIADALTIPLSEAEQIKRDKLTIPDSAGISPVIADPFGLTPSGDDFQAYNPFGDAPAPYAAAPGDAASVPPAADETTAYGMEASQEPTESVAPPPVDHTPAPAVSGEDARYYNAVAPILEELVAEIRRSIDYYRSRGGDVNQVEVCGGGAKIHGLNSFIERSLSIPCDSFDPTRRLSINERKVPPAYVEEHRGEFAVAIGNGLHIFFD